MPPSRIKAIILAIFVVIIWSTSWILIKVGMEEIPALSLNGLRYTLAFFLMLPFLLLPKVRIHFIQMSRKDWNDLVILGFVFIGLTQGALALSLVYLPAVTASLIMNCTPVFVAFLGIGFLSERPTGLQWGGLSINMAGVFLYFFPLQNKDNNWIGLVIALGCMFFNIIGSLLSRRINRGARLNAYIVSTVSIGVGGLMMLLAGIIVNGLPVFKLDGLMILGWLAVVNTAVAFPMWNYSLQTLTAMESNIIGNTMLIYVAILAFIFLGEQLTLQQGIGLILTGVGAVLVQMHSIGKPKQQNDISAGSMNN
jgi:drug/metabolite transporter (DMT)-like permease